MSTVRPEAEAYEGGDGPVGVLAIHGFTGSTASMRPWARHLEEAGFAVSVPRLPGHGTTWQDLNRHDWTEWYAEADRAFRALRQRCATVFLGGLSMGGALALRLAQQHGTEVAGLVLINPVINITDPRMRALPLLRLLVPSFPGITNDIAQPGRDEAGYDRLPLRALWSQTFLWRDVQAHLGWVDQPLLVYRSRNDHVGDASSVAMIAERIRSTDQTYVELTRSYHVATLDYEADAIFSGSVEFYQRLAGQR